MQSDTSSLDLSSKRIFYKYTINSQEIPTPFSGYTYDPENPGTKLRLTKDDILKLEKTYTSDPSKLLVELKVIAVVEGIMPSEVASCSYEVREGQKPIRVEQSFEQITRPRQMDQVSSQDHVFLSGSVLVSGGSDHGVSSVTSSPGLGGGEGFFNF